MTHRTTPDFWDHYDELPAHIQEKADKDIERANAYWRDSQKHRNCEERAP